MKKVQFEGIHWHYLNAQNNSLNEYIDQYKGQDLAARQWDRRSSPGEIFVKILLSDLSETREISKCRLTLQDLSKILLAYAKISRSCLQDVSLGQS